MALLYLAGGQACSSSPPPLPAPAATAPPALSSAVLPASAASPEPAPPVSSAVASSVPLAASSAPPAAQAPPLEITLRVKGAIFGEHPRVYVQAPGSLRHLPQTPIVVFLHGWYGCLPVLVGPDAGPCRPGQPTRFAMDLRAQFAAAGVEALLVVPQLAFDEASSAPGKLVQAGQLRSLLTEVLTSAAVAPYVSEGAAIGRVILVGHSGAYLPLGRALGRGGVDVSEVWMFDAHYLDVPELRPWFEAHRGDFVADPPRRRLAFIYTESEKTGPRSLRLLSALTRSLPDADRARVLWQGEASAVAEETLRHALVAQQTEVPHERIPRAFLVPLLRSAGLTTLAEAPPTIAPSP